LQHGLRKEIINLDEIVCMKIVVSIIDEASKHNIGKTSKYNIGKVEVLRETNATMENKLFIFDK